MAGFNFTPPPGAVPALPVDLLSRLAQAGFRPGALTDWKPRPNEPNKPPGSPSTFPNTGSVSALTVPDFRSGALFSKGGFSA